MEENSVPIFFAPIETHCPICGKPVRKVIEANRKCDSPCSNEFMCHTGDTLIKFKDPKGAWESSADFKAIHGN